MSAETIQPRIHQLLEAKDFVALKSAVAEMEVHELTDLLTELEGTDLAVVFRLLPSGDAADVFGDLPLELQEELLDTLSSAKVATILNDMPPDERTELLEELPGELAQRFLRSLRGEELRIARDLLNYPEQSIGRLMTPEYVAIKPDWTIAEVLTHIRGVAPAKETINMAYVVDARSKLIDEVSLEQLVLSDPDASVQDLMDGHVAALEAYEDQEAAIDEFKKYEAVALPVVNSQGILVGIVTVDDVMDVQEEENTEDFQKMAAVGAMESSYFHTSYFRMMAKRLPWLVLLFLAEILTVITLDAFGGSIDHKLLAIMVGFVPLINSCAGNTGSQMAGLMIRGLAVAEIDSADWAKVMGRELMRGVSLGVVLGLMGFATVMVFGKGLSLAWGVMLALVAVMALANLLGSMLPLFFKRIGVDPAVTSGPFIASIMDVSAILVYFSIAAAILHAAG